MSLNLDDNKRPYFPQLNLGETFDEIQAAFNAAQYTETIVDISPAQIFAGNVNLGTDINIGLPIQYANTYMDFYIYAEYTGRSVPYDLKDAENLVIGFKLNGIEYYQLSAQDALVMPEGAKIYWIYKFACKLTNLPYANSPHTVKVYDNNEVQTTPITDGNGSFKIKFYHKVITFG